MTTPVPKYLYRYMAFPPEQKSQEVQDKIKRMESLFVESKVYMVSPLWFNDPFDCKRTFSKEGFTQYHVEKYARLLVGRGQSVAAHKRKQKSEELIKLWGSDRELLLNTLEKGAINSCKKIGILSLSKTPIDILMWSHYANGHQGLCVQLDVERLPNVKNALHEVKYSDCFPSFTEYIYGDDKTQNRLLFATKAIHWKYEQEWRYFYLFANGVVQIEKDPIYLPDDSLSAVILGCEMDDKHKDTVKGWISKRKTPIKICQAVRSKTQYSVEIDGLPQP